MDIVNKALLFLASLLIVLGFLVQNRPVDIEKSTVKVCAIFSLGMKCGTGMQVDGGRVITDFHVISPDGPLKPIILVLKSGMTTFIPAIVISTDAGRDLAILNTQYNKKSDVILRESYRLGDEVDVIGNPGGRDFERTKTTITGTFLSYIPGVGFTDLIQLDSQNNRIRAGYSGGGVFLNGEMIGTVEACEYQSNTCLAIPTKILKSQLRVK